MPHPNIICLSDKRINQFEISNTSSNVKRPIKIFIQVIPSGIVTHEMRRFLLEIKAQLYKNQNGSSFQQQVPSDSSSRHVMLD